MSSSQKVARLSKKGDGVNAIRITNEPIPTPQDHQVVVRLHAGSLNFRDYAIAAGRYPFPTKDNLVPLSDGAGEVVQVGSAVTGWKKGDRVVANFTDNHFYGDMKDWNHGYGGPLDGMLREYGAFSSESLLRIPDHLSYEEAATLPCTAVTAWNALFGAKPLIPGQTVLLMGTGGVSITALLLAKASGATVIITSSSEDKLKRARELGADYTINYKTSPQWDEEAKKITKGVGVDFVLENGGAPTIERSINALKPGGTVAVIGFLAYGAEEFKMPDVAMLVLGKGAIVRGVNIGPKEMFEQVLNLVDQRKIRPVIDKTFPFTDHGIKDAYQFMEKAGHFGKLVIKIA